MNFDILAEESSTDDVKQPTTANLAPSLANRDFVSYRDAGTSRDLETGEEDEPATDRSKPFRGRQSVDLTRTPSKISHPSAVPTYGRYAHIKVKSPKTLGFTVVGSCDDAYGGVFIQQIQSSSVFANFLNSGDRIISVNEVGLLGATLQKVQTVFKKATKGKYVEITFQRDETDKWAAISAFATQNNSKTTHLLRSLTLVSDDYESIGGLIEISVQRSSKSAPLGCTVVGGSASRLGGLFVSEVQPDSIASVHDIRVGDRILEIDQQSQLYTTNSEFTASISNKTSFTLIVQRLGNTQWQSIVAFLQKIYPSDADFFKQIGAITAEGSIESGFGFRISVQPLPMRASMHPSASIRREYRVMVSDVTWAAKVATGQELVPGQLIHAINDKPVSNKIEVLHALNSFSNSIAIEVIDPTSPRVKILTLWKNRRQVHVARNAQTHSFGFTTISHTHIQALRSRLLKGLFIKNVDDDIDLRIGDLNVGDQVLAVNNMDILRVEPSASHRLIASTPDVVVLDVIPNLEGLNKVLAVENAQSVRNLPFM